MERIKTQVSLTGEQQFLERLRSATNLQHKALEATSLSQKLVSNEVTKSDYFDYLAHMQPVIAYCEEFVFPLVAHLLPDIEQRRKLPAIMQDLEILNSGMSASDFTAYGAKLAVNAVPFALGYMYTIEGSTLGGRMLLNHIKSTLGYNEDRGARYFAGYGAQTGSRWKDFLQIFSGYAIQHNCQDEIINGSNYAFISIENHFAQTIK